MYNDGHLIQIYSYDNEDMHKNTLEHFTCTLGIGVIILPSIVTNTEYIGMTVMCT